MSAISPAAPDIATVKVASGTSAADALAAAGVSPNDAVVVRDVASGLLRDLSWAPDADVEVEPVAADTGRPAVIRHSAAHVLAQAVQDAVPRGQARHRPADRDGFYYDFDVADAVHPRGPRSAREADGADRQGGPAVLPPRRSPRTRPATSSPTSRTSWSWSSNKGSARRRRGRWRSAATS